MKVKFIQPIFDIIAEYDDDDDKKMQNFYQMIKYDDNDDEYGGNDHSRKNRNLSKII